MTAIFFKFQKLFVIIWLWLSQFQAYHTRLPPPHPPLFAHILKENDQCLTNSQEGAGGMLGINWASKLIF